TKSFWVAAFDSGQPTDIVSKVTETGHTIKTVKVASGVDAIATDPTRGFVWTIGNSSDGSTHTLSFIRESNNSVHATSVPSTVALPGLGVDRAPGRVSVLAREGDVLTANEPTPTAAPTGFITGVISAASGIAIDHGTDRIWVLNASGNSVFGFSESTGAM